MLDRAAPVPAGRGAGELDAYSSGGSAFLPDYSDVPNWEGLRNPEGLAAAALPLTLRVLSHVTLVVSSRRSATSGSPTHVFAKLYLA